MINEKMHALGDEPSAIRELFAYGMERKAQVGADNVFDYSIGNPSVPAPPKVRETILRLMEEDPMATRPPLATPRCATRWLGTSANATACLPPLASCT